MHLLHSGSAASPVPPTRHVSDEVDHLCECTRETYLAAMRQVAGSVAVVTTDGPAGRQGATVTAFCSVSADPPTVLVCLRSGSRIAEAVQANGVFTLNVLPENADLIARTFAGAFDSLHQDRFAGVDLIEEVGLAPAIGGTLSLACRVARHGGHESHTIFFGAVASIGHRLLPPLAYHDGGYCGLRAIPQTPASSLRTE
ncbi:MAG: flavin reductase family protein [Gemmobacter sp.]